MYIAVDNALAELNPFKNPGFTEEQIGEVSEAEKIIAIAIDRYLYNLRLKCFNVQVEANEYMEVQHAVKVLGAFFEFVHQLPLDKQQLDRDAILRKAEEEAEKLARDNRGE